MTLAPPHDQLGRPLRDLRISVTDRCNLRCPYCMPAELYGEAHPFLERAQLLSFEEIARVARIAVSLGVEKLRVTGGEPLLRRHLDHLIAMLAEIPGAPDLALTTNGLLLAAQANALKAAGLRRVTVSLDSLDDSVAGQMNGRGVAVAPVLEGIDAALAAGFENVKVNVVVRRGVNDAGVLDLVRHFRGTPCTLRFIEFMDVGTLNQWKLEEVVPARELLAQISAEFPLRPLSPAYRGEVAQRYAFEDGQGEVGFIASVSQPFCGDCTRLRLSADGALYTCLFAAEGHDLRAPLRAGASDADLHGRMAGIWAARSDRYSEIRASATAPRAHVEMYHIGG
jgi:cyclic pyranopterin phosphate synthase